MRTDYLFKHFMLVQTTHLPIVGIDGLIMGFLSKEKIQIEMADLSRGLQDWEIIPEDFLDYELPDTLLSFFQNNTRIMVLDSAGSKKDYWDKAKLLSEYSRWVTEKDSRGLNNSLLEVRSKNEPIDTGNVNDPVAWLVRKILEGFSDPLFATDIQGNSIFFNDGFEKKILNHQMFRDSVQFAERFLRDLNKDVFAAFLKANELDISKAQENGRVLQTILPQLGYQVKIVTLTEKEKMIGYLYHFIELRSRMSGMGEEGFELPNLEEAFANRIPLNVVLVEVESFYIFKSLMKNKLNVSHSSYDLGIPRSTLQNRIKQLELEKKFPMNTGEPVPRKKSKSNESIKIKSKSRKEYAQPHSKSKKTNPKSKILAKTPKGKGLEIKKPEKLKKEKTLKTLKKDGVSLRKKQKK